MFSKKRWPTVFFLKYDAVSKFLKANDLDDALFVQFDLPPTHEAAMFLKTSLQIVMDELEGWSKSPTELEAMLQRQASGIMDNYEKFATDKTMPCSAFERLFKENMERKQVKE